MDSLNKIRWKKACKWIAVYGLIVAFAILSAWFLKEQNKRNTYYIPKEEINAEDGIPEQVKLEELNPTKNIRIGFHNPVYVEGEKVYVYLTNYKENEVAISAFLYDENKELYAESGMIKQEQYLPYLVLDKETEAGKEYYINVAFLNEKDMTSEGSIWIRIGALESEK